LYLLGCLGIFSQRTESAVISLADVTFKNLNILGFYDSFSHERHKVHDSFLANPEDALVATKTITTMVPGEKGYSDVDDAQLVLNNVCKQKIAKFLADVVDLVHRGVIAD
jgi:hypothetical protein